jgi:hypothetical protein
MYECHEDECRRKYDTAAFYRLLETATPEMINVRLTNAANIWLTDDGRCRVTNPNSRFSKDQFVTEAPLETACDMLDLHLMNALLAKRADPNFSATSKHSKPGEQSVDKAVASHSHFVTEKAKKGASSRKRRTPCGPRSPRHCLPRAPT